MLHRGQLWHRLRVEGEEQRLQPEGEQQRDADGEETDAARRRGRVASQGVPLRQGRSVLDDRRRSQGRVRTSLGDGVQAASTACSRLLLESGHCW